MEEIEHELLENQWNLLDQGEEMPPTNTNNREIEEMFETTQTSPTPAELQQEFYENLDSDSDWVKYEYEKRKFLLQNVAYALFGAPSCEGDLTELIDVQNPLLGGYTNRQMEQVNKVYKKICEQSKYSQNDEDIVMSVLLVVCAKPKPLNFFQITPADYWVDLHNRRDIDVSTTPVFRVKKCVPTTDGGKSCKVYIDESARVYRDWDSFLLNNTLPKCVMVVPRNGEYKGDIIEGSKDFCVRLSVVPSPALGVKARVLSSADAVSTVASVGAIGVIGAAMFTPVGPVVLAGATVATVATGLYGLVRSSIHLRDRSVHEQTISPTDHDARGSWLNIAASSVGLAAGAASTMLSKSAAAGTNMTKAGKALTMSVEVLRHTNIVTGGAGVVNGLFVMVLKYKKHGEKPTKLEIFQFTAATLFFYGAVMSNRTAQNIIEEAQAKTINEYRDTLRSNRHRRIFDKISAESRRTQGQVQGNTEVIRGISSIADKDQYFADVLKINKDINQHKLRISMTSDGQVNLNAAHKFTPAELRAMGAEGRTDLFTSLGPARLAAKNVPTQVAPCTTAVITVKDKEEKNFLIDLRPGEIIRLGNLLFKITTSGADTIACMLENLSEDIHVNLMTVSMAVMAQLLPEEIAKLRLLNPYEDLSAQMVKFVFQYMKHKRPLGEPSESDDGIVVVLKEFFQDGKVRQETILQLKEKLVENITAKLELWQRQHPNKKALICGQCQGVRFA